MTDMSNFTRAVAAPDGQPGATLKALDALVKDVVGARLFTVMTFDEATQEASRAYSDRPDEYPVSGRKPANRTHWSQIVMERHETFVANDIAAIASVFPDHELIASLGCESCINVPAVWQGKALGTLNILHEAGHFTPDRVAAAEALKLPGILALLTLQAAENGDPQ